MIEPGIKINDSELDKVLGRIVQRSSDKRPVLKTIGAIGRESVRRNFREGGRPTKWTPSKRVEGKRGQTLRKSGRLQNSITSSVSSDSVIIGTNTVYAAVHNFGALKFSFGTVVAKVPAHRRKAKGRNMKSGRKKTASGVVFVKAHTRKMKLPWGDIPAREFMVLQQQDLLEIEGEMAGYLIEGE
jgi:phage virion morphogenesis protein